MFSVMFRHAGATILFLCGYFTVAVADICSSSDGQYFTCSALESCCGNRCCSNKVKIVGVVCAVVAVMLLLCRCCCPRRNNFFGAGNDRILVAETISTGSPYEIRTQAHHLAPNSQNTTYLPQNILPPMYPIYSVHQQTAPVVQFPSNVPDTPPPAYSEVVTPPPQYSVVSSNLQPVKGDVKLVP